MNHVLTAEYWQYYDALPQNLQARADFCFRAVRENPRYPSLHLKRIGKFWSLRINREYRALGIHEAEQILWFWVGTHTEYEKILRGRAPA